MSDLTQLEVSVLKKLLEGGDEPVLSILRKQLGEIEVVQRKFTATGFYTDFALRSEVPRIAGKQSLAFGDVGITIADSGIGGGFVLFVRDGALGQLEGYTYRDEPWPQEISDFELSYVAGGKPGKKRDLEHLRKRLAQ